MTNDSTTSLQKSSKNVSATLMTVREMIETAFGDDTRNFVNFKLIQTILMVLGKHLRLLDRQVAVELDPEIVPSSSNSIVVSEIKLKSVTRKKTEPITKHYLEQDSRGKPLQVMISLNEKRLPSESFSNKKGVPGRKFELNSNEGLRRSSSIEFPGTSYQKLSQRPKKQYSKHLSQQDDESELSRSKLKSIDSVGKMSVVSSQKYLELLEKIEEQREQILRIINQRQDSMEEGPTPPTPMASLTSLDIKYEKLLIVERLNSKLPEEFKKSHDVDRKRPLSIVTKDQFDQLFGAVGALQKQIDNSAARTPMLPENAELMKELRKGASLTDAIAAFQLSARLETAEKGLEKLSSLVTDLINETKGLKHSSPKYENETPFKVRSITTLYVIKDNSPPNKSPRKETAGISSPENESPRKEHPTESIRTTQSILSARTTSELSVEVDATSSHNTCSYLLISKKQLRNALTKEQTEIVEIILKSLRAADNTATEALKKAANLERKLINTTSITPKLLEIEKMMTNYSEQVNTIDTVLSSQLANYQDQLTQMQFDLESALENMAESLTGQGVDPEVLLEMNTNFSRLQNEMEKTALVQMEAMRVQKRFSNGLESLKREIEFLRDIKCDRDEVNDALRDKAGIKELNGLLSIDFHMATLGDFDMRFKYIGDRIESKEQKWQRAIEELSNKICNKVDIIHLEALRDDINKHINNLKQKIDKMSKILGEPIASAVTRKIYRDTKCISCSSPAHLMPENGKVPCLPGARSRATDAKDSKPKDDGDHSVCIPGARIPHSVDPRAKICTRYCGGTLLPKRRNLRSKELRTRRLFRDNSCSVDDDGIQTYKIAGEAVRPCIPCNERREPSEGLEAEPDSITASIPEEEARTCHCDVKVADASCLCGVEAGQMAENASLDSIGSLMNILE